MSDKIKAPVPLSVMTGEGEFIVIKDKNYVIKPIALNDVEEFMTAEMNLGCQLFSVHNAKEREKIDRWLGGKGNKKGYCYDEDGKPVNLEKVMADGWDIVDLKKFMNKLCDLSG